MFFEALYFGHFLSFHTMQLEPPKDEATHSPRSWETKGSRKFLAPLKRTSVMLSSVRVSREKGITRAIQGNGVEGGGCGHPEGGCPRHPPTLEPLCYTVVQHYTT